MNGLTAPKNGLLIAYRINSIGETFTKRSWAGSQIEVKYNIFVVKKVTG